MLIAWKITWAGTFKAGKIKAMQMAEKRMNSMHRNGDLLFFKTDE
jgi:hypothetical protein